MRLQLSWAAGQHIARIIACKQQYALVENCGDTATALPVTMFLRYSLSLKKIEPGSLYSAEFMAGACHQAASS